MRSFFILMLVVIVGVVVVSKAETNRLSPLILPPADWDATKHRLASFVAKNQPGGYPLPFVWAGMEKVTARIGWYATKDAIAEQTNQWLEFDKFTVSRQPAVRMFRAGFISRGEQGYGWASYRAALPSDAELLQMRDASSVSNFLGWNPFSGETNFVTRSPSIRLFTLRPYDSIETLQVTFKKRSQDSRIDSILVKRGSLQPQPTKQ
jgi:hypothetical protein